MAGFAGCTPRKGRAISSLRSPGHGSYWQGCGRFIEPGTAAAGHRPPLRPRHPVAL
jgi:hypothetical protein